MSSTRRKSMPMGVYERKKKPLEERFYAMLSRPSPTDCWEWQGAKDPKGYGRFNVGGATRLAHRISWSLKHGEISDKALLCHKCDNRACCNPDHLYPGDHADNVRDMVSRRRFEHGERHHSSKLTTEEVRQIRSINGVYQETIAGLYGISGSLVSMIKSGKTRRFEG